MPASATKAGRGGTQGSAPGPKAWRLGSLDGVWGLSITSCSAVYNLSLCLRELLRSQGMCGFGGIVGLEEYRVQWIECWSCLPAVGLPTRAGWSCWGSGICP